MIHTNQFQPSKNRHYAGPVLGLDAALPIILNPTVTGALWEDLGEQSQERGGDSRSGTESQGREGKGGFKIGVGAGEREVNGRERDRKSVV